MCRRFQCLKSHLEPFPDGISGELCTVTRADMIGWVVLDEQISQTVQYLNLHCLVTANMRQFRPKDYYAMLIKMWVLTRRF